MMGLMLRCGLGVAAVWCLGIRVLADEGLVVSNRAAGPDEWGYRPADGETVRLNPPSWTWIHEPRAASYRVQWSRSADFQEAETADGVVWPTYTHDEPLAPGGWFWRYQFLTKTGEASGWSVARRVVVPESATAFPMPGRAEQRRLVPAVHPRLFVRPEDLPRIRSAAKGAEEAAFDRLRRQADRIIAQGPTPEPEHLGSARDKDDAEMVKYWWPNREQTQRACEEAEVLAFVGMVSGEEQYRQAARRWVLHLAAWDPDGPTNFRLNCEAAKPLIFRLPRAYDWAFDALTEEERATVRRVMQRRVKDAWESGEVQGGVGHLNRPYNSHGNRIWHKIGEAGIALLGEVPEAETWLDYALNKFYACYPVWSDDDGGWHEGVSYWGGYLSKAVWWLQAERSGLGIDGLKKPFFAQFADYPMYVAPPGSPNMGFGDLSYRPISKGTGAFLEYVLRAGGEGLEGSRAGYWRWWAERSGMRLGEPEGVLGFLYRVNLGPLPPARDVAELPPSKVFHGIGVASLHTNLRDSGEDVHMLFKSSPFGSQSHGHNPQNSFQVNAYGEALLVACGYRDLHGSRFHYQWVHSTKAQNALLVDGQGQKMHAAGVQGRIVSERLEPGFDYVVGDATAAYEGRLTRYRRHVVLAKGPSLPVPVVLVFDEIEATKAATFQVMLHALAPFEIDEAGGRLEVEQPEAGVSIGYLSPVPLHYRQWDGFEPAPTQKFANMWHAEAGTSEARERLVIVTVIVPHRKDEAVAWEARRIDTPGASGIAMTVGGVPLEVAVRLGDGETPARWEGREFEGPVMVRP